MNGKCPDCDTDIPLDGVEESEVISCPCCGLELEYKKGILVELVIEGQDWGELIGLFKLKGKPNSYHEWRDVCK
jgi:predicted amidophosphoribosyltransferase